MPSLIQKHAHVKGQRSNHHIFKFQPNPSWAKKRPNRYTSFDVLIDFLFPVSFGNGSISVLFLALYPDIEYYSMGFKTQEV